MAPPIKDACSTFKEYESCSQMLNRIPKKQLLPLFKSSPNVITCFDANTTFLMFGTNSGDVVFYNRKSNGMNQLNTKRFQAVTCIGFQHGLDVRVAVGYAAGAIEILIIPLKEDQLNLEQLCIFPLLEAHQNDISAICWSSNGEFVFSGDFNGVLHYCRFTNKENDMEVFPLGQEDSGVVGLNYRHRTLLVATFQQCHLRTGASLLEKVTVGTKMITTPQCLGACFMPLLCKPEDAKVFVCRPKNRLWLANAHTGVVLHSLVFDSQRLFHPDLDIALLLSSCAKSANVPVEQSDDSGMCRVIPVNDQIYVLWTEFGLSVLQYNQATLSECDVIACSRRLGHIIDVRCTFEEKSKQMEIFVLRQFVDGVPQLVRLANFSLQKAGKVYFQSASATVMESPSELKTGQTDPTESRTSGKLFDNWRQRFQGFIDERVVKGGEMKQSAQKLYEDLVTIEVEGVEHAVDATSVENEEDIPATELSANVPATSSLPQSTFKMRSLFDQLWKDRVADSKATQLDGSINEWKQWMGSRLPWPSAHLDGKFQASTWSEEVDQYLIADEVPAEDVLQRIEVNAEETLSEKLEENAMDQRDSFVVTASIISSPEILFAEKKKSESPVLMTVLPTYQEDNEDDITDLDDPIEVDESFELTDSYERRILLNGLPNTSSETNLQDEFLQVEASSPVEPQALSKESQQEGEEQLKNPYDHPAVNVMASQHPRSSFTNHFSGPMVVSTAMLCESSTSITVVCPASFKSLCVCYHIVYAVDTNNCIFAAQLHRAKGHLLQGAVNQSISLQWTPANNSDYLADSLHVSPCGGIVWRLRQRHLFAYSQPIQSTTMIHETHTVEESQETLKSSQQKQKGRFFRRRKSATATTEKQSHSKTQLWRTVCENVRCVDVDTHMAVYVKDNGEMLFQLGLANGRPLTAPISVLIPKSDKVLVVACRNGIVWVLVRLKSATSTTSTKGRKGVFAMFVEDFHDANAIGALFQGWCSVQVKASLIGRVTSLHVGDKNTAWICTKEQRCFFTTDVTELSPTGSGLWFEISLHRFIPQPTFVTVEENESLQIFSKRDKNRPRVDETTASSVNTCLSVKCSPILHRQWLSPLWLYSSVDRTIHVPTHSVMGHRWVPVDARTDSSVNLPVQWQCITTTFVNHQTLLWCSSRASNLIFSLNLVEHYREPHPLPLSCNILSLTGSDQFLYALTEKEGKKNIFHRLGITPDTPRGQDWVQIADLPIQREHIRSINASGARLWLVDESGGLFWTDRHSFQVLGGKEIDGKVISLLKPQWNNLYADGNVREASTTIQEVSGSWHWPVANGDEVLWAMDKRDRVYTLAYDFDLKKKCWIYVPDAKASSLCVSAENVWILTSVNKQILIRNGIDLDVRPGGNDWLHIPTVYDHPLTISALAVGCNNAAWIICNGEILQHEMHILSLQPDEQAGMPPEIPEKASQSVPASSSGQVERSKRLGKQLTQDLEEDWEFVN